MTVSAHLTSPRVLVVEDESVVAMLVEDMLLELGFEVAGVASRLQTGLAMAAELAIDVAVLDVNLGAGVPSFPIANILRERGVPFIFATGYGRAGIGEEFSGVTVIQKPFRADDLQLALQSAIVGASPRTP